MFTCGGASTEQSEAFLGSRLSWVSGFLPQGSWSAAHQSARGLSRLRGSGRQLTYGVGMLTGDGGSLQQGAAGRYDGQWRQLAQEFVAAGVPNIHLRLGWEMNGDWFRWSALRDPGAYAAYWRRIVNVMRSVPGGRSIKFDWVVSQGAQFVPLASYPGDQYVDVIGMNVYDRTYNTRYADPGARWDHYVSRPFGLQWLRDFSRAHGKPIGFGEWGVSSAHVGGVQRDNPLFINRMADFIRSNNVAYHSYFNCDSNYLHRLDHFPRSRDAVRARF